MGSGLLDVGLNMKLYASKAINGFLKETMEVGERGGGARKLEGLIRDFEAERGKIEVFKRELPLSTQILSNIISILKDELERCQKSRVFEEFMPVKSTFGKNIENTGAKLQEDSKDKKSWMSSAQLWSHSEEDSTEKPQIRPSQKSTTCGFMPSKGVARKEEKVDVSMPDLSLLSYKSVTGVTENCTSGAPRISIQSQSQVQQRKTRRCWSPELHRRFVSALQQLGGAQVATPKQIRDLMKVDGLTNDEVKSHLQKYRLHTRRAPTNNASCKDQQSTTSQQSMSNSQSGSPTGHLRLSIATAGENCEEEDERTDSYDWNL